MSGKFFRAGVGLVLASGLLHAGVLAPGATIPLSGTTFSGDTELGGSIKWDNLIPFEIRNAAGDVFISGILKDRVVLSSATGLLIFNRSIQDLSAPSATARIVAMAGTHFAGLEVEAEFRFDSGGPIYPVEASRSGGDGDIVGFDFTGSDLAPPDASSTCFAKTTANGFRMGASVTISGVEAPGGTVYSVVVGNAAKPQLLPPTGSS